MSDVQVEAVLLDILKTVPAETSCLISTEPDRIAALSTASGISGRQLTDAVCLDADERMACAILVGLLEHLPKQDGLHLLASLRDIHAREVIAVVPLDCDDFTSVWQETDLLGMGMKRQARYSRQARDYAIYAFSLKNYKPAPDWLNSRFWANPELYGKFRW